MTYTEFIFTSASLEQQQKMCTKLKGLNLITLPQGLTQLP